MKSRIFCKTTNCRKWSKLNDEGLCPTCQAEPSAEIASEECKCNICSEKVEEADDKVIGCDICETWCHEKCVGSSGLLKLLHEVAKANSHSSDISFLGNLLWVCPKCLTGPPKAVSISKDSCSLDKPNARTIQTEGNLSSSITKPICKDYRHGLCNKGDTCQFSHPDKCLNYCRYGKKGCNSGFANCKLLHPVLCRNSLNKGVCFDSKCTLAHLKGTVRSRKSFNPVPPGYEYTPNSARGYSSYDPRKLGFLGYQQSKYPPQDQGQRNQKSHSYEDHNYGPSDYPGLPSNEVNGNPSNENGFLELVKTIQEMQKAQTFFHNELMALKTQVIHPTGLPNVASQTMFSQPQFQSTSQLNQL